MECNYSEYQKLVHRLFYGVALTDNHMNQAIEQVRMYLVNGGGAEVMNSLGIGLKVVTQQFEAFPGLDKEIKRCFVFLSGENKGRELTVREIETMGMFLKGGPFYGCMLVKPFYSKED